MPYMLFVLHYYMINIMHAEYILDSISLFRYIYTYIFSLQFFLFSFPSSFGILLRVLYFFFCCFIIPLFVLAHRKNQ